MGIAGNTANVYGADRGTVMTGSCRLIVVYSLYYKRRTQ